MVTMKMVAKEANVSAMTVSRVLNNAQEVNEETRERVLNAIDKLNYQPNQAARIIRGGKSNILGVLIPDFTNPFYNELLKYIEKYAVRSGFRILIASNTASTDQIENVQYLLNRNVDAVIICSYTAIKDASKYILKHSPNIPTVILDKLSRDKRVNSVYADGFTDIKNVVEYLIGIGHKRIAMIKGKSDYLIANDRFLGYVEALKQHNIEIDDELVWEGEYTIESGEEAAEYFLSLKNAPTAIVSSSDYMAIGAINHLIQLGYKIPEDFSVTGYDGIYLGEVLHPHLTTVKLPIEEMARKTVEILTDEIKSGKKNEQNGSVFCYHGDLVIRASTKENVKA